MAVSISQLTELTSILDDDVFPITAVRNTKSTGKIKYSTIKQSILDSVPTPVSDWRDITNKPFTSIGEGLSVDTNGILSASGLDFETLSGMIVQGTNMSIITDSNAKTITFNATGGIDFDALAVAMTTGTQSGISVTADTENSRFNFEVTGIPTIAIDSEGYWTIDGNRGENPTKAQGEKGNDGANGVNGKDGASPTIDPTTKNWIVGTVDTGIKAEAHSNYFYTGTEFPTSDLIDGDLFLSFADDTRGNVYQYQELTLDWSLQGNLYGGGAVIDDTSTSGNTVTWSANKINSVIGNINTILASVTGGIS